MSLFAYALLAVVACGTIVVEAQHVPTMSDVPSFWFDTLQDANTSATVSLGDNVTIACNFTNKALAVVIVRWHPNKDSVDDKTKMRRLLPLVKDKNFETDFEAILNQFSEFSGRISMHYDSSSTVWFTISNFQYEDAGDFGCYAYKGGSVSQYANLSISVTDTIVYADLAGNQQQSINLTTEEVLTTFNCSLYHVFGYQDAITTAWFDTCKLFDAAGNKLPTPQCDNINKQGVFVDMLNFTDPERYGDFWPRSFQRTKMTTNISLSSSFYNRSVGCFARKNNNETVSDFQTIVQEGVDLHLDPANFRCSPHHVTTKYNEHATFSCVVQRPVYRQYDIFWEVTTNKDVKKCQTDTSCRDLNGVFVKNVEEKNVNLYVTEVTAKVEVKANQHTDVYKYRLVAQYLNNTKRFESDYFDLKVTGVPPPSDTVKEKPSGASHHYVSFSYVLALAAFVLAFRM